MDQSTLHSIEAHCTQEAMPRCQAHCPLHLDVRAFMAHIQDGKWNEARKVLDRHLPLPNILARICDHPCEGHCLRRDFGGSLAIQSLEKLCIEHTEKQGKSFPRPPKAQKVAVLGNGIAGLTVAYELAKKSFPVTIFYDKTSEEQKTSFLCQYFPQLHKEHVQAELEQLEKQHTTFCAASLSQAYFTTLQESGEYTAFFVDAHAAPALHADFLAKKTQNTATFAPLQVAENICVAGMLEQSPTGAGYASPAKQAGQGRQAALTLERIVTNVSLHAGRIESLGVSKLHTPIRGLQPKQAIFPQDDTYSLEEAQQEAGRCIQCECMQCVKECVYLQKYGSFPRAYTRQIYNNTAIVLGDHKANSLINGCMLCGQCTEICPERFSMIEVCIDARQDMVEKNYMPPSAFEFAVDDMLSASQAPCSLFMRAPRTTENPSHVFFPGCQLSALRSEQVFAVYEMLCATPTTLPSVGLILSCCGIPAYWAGQKAHAQEHMQHIEQQWQTLGKPTFIMACASCMRHFATHAPHIPCVSLWEILLPLIPATAQTTPAQHFTMHDPCGARNNTAWQEAVRKLAASQHISIADHALQGAQTPCCGFGGNVWCSQPDLAESATKNLQKTLKTPKVMQADSVAKQNAPQSMLVSCVMCQDRLQKIGQNCLYVFDILPSLASIGKTQNAATQNEATSYQSYGLSARRARRASLVEKILHTYGTKALLPVTQVDNDSVRSEAIHGHEFLHIAPHVLEEMERKHILHQDVALAVRMVEEHQGRFVEKESGHFIGAWRQKNVTFWVRYSQDDTEQFHLHDAWCHRMHVPNSTANSIKDSL